MLVRKELDVRNNAFDFLRLLLALGVVYAHCRYMYGVEDFLHWNAKGFESLHVGTVAVFGFFAISGFLVAGSWRGSSGFANFIEKRFRRILPGFWLSLLVCSLCFIPLWFFIKNSSFNGLWDEYGLVMWRFVTVNFDTAIHVQAAPGLADDINGPLWTIRHELYCYLSLGVLGVLGVLAKGGRASIIFLGLAVVVHLLRVWYVYDEELSSKYGQWFGDQHFLMFLSIFLWGSYIYTIKDKIPLTWGSAMTCVVILVIGTKADMLIIFFPLVFAYLAISLAYSIPIYNIAERIGDLSFGIYLYHWPVRVTMQNLGWKTQLDFTTFLMINIVLTIPLAVASWYLVERKFLYKSKKEVINNK